MSDDGNASRQSAGDSFLNPGPQLYPTRIAASLPSGRKTHHYCAELPKRKPGAEFTLPSPSYHQSCIHPTNQMFANFPTLPRQGVELQRGVTVSTVSACLAPETARGGAAAAILAEAWLEIKAIVVDLLLRHSMERQLAMLTC